MSLLRTSTCFVLFAALGAPGGASEGAESPGLYVRCLTRSIERAQLELERDAEVWREHTTWEEAVRGRSEHYELRTTRSRGYGAGLARGLDEMLGHFQYLLGTDYLPTAQFQVWVFPTLAEYNTFGGTFAEHTSFYGSFFAAADVNRPVALLYDTNLVLVRMLATHSALHQYVDHAFSQPLAAWASEGLASYFALFWDTSYGPSELRRILAAEQTQFVPLRDLLTTAVSGYPNRPQSRLIELGMLFVYLLAEREDTRTDMRGGVEVQAPFAEYLRALVRGQDVTGDAVHRLLFERTDELERDFRAFALGD